jgi:2-polyprenyl-6-hydroxyphenyl methylase/3-demethylubiquinone-9 3-methyltransferase
MTVTPRNPNFLNHYLSSQRREEKLVWFEANLRSIRREMERTGIWREGLRVLDIGCGLGYQCEFFHEHGMRATGVDVDPDLIACARERAAHGRLPLRLEVGSAERLPFGDEEFDIVYANSVLEHVIDWQASVSEWARVLAPGGALWIQTTNVFHPRQAEYRWLPLYSWWPGPLKRLAVRAARGPFPALANFTPCPALHWFSFFQLREYLATCGLSAYDLFDFKAPPRPGTPKALVWRLACSSELGRRLVYVLLPMVILIARKDPTAPGYGAPRVEAAGNGEMARTTSA